MIRIHNKVQLLYTFNRIAYQLLYDMHTICYTVLHIQYNELQVYTYILVETYFICFEH